MSLAGRIVLWRVTEMPYAKMCEAWNQAGYPANKIPVPDCNQALRHTLSMYTQANPELFFRVREQEHVLFLEDEKEDRFYPMIRFSIHAGNKVTTKKTKIKNQKLKNKLDEDAKTILAEYKRQLELFGASAVSEMLTDVAVTVAHGAKLRPGVYFIPEPYLPAWREIGETLQKVAEHTFYEIPIMPCAAVDHAVASAVLQHLEEATTSFEKISQAREQAEKTLSERAKAFFTLDRKQNRNEQKREALLAGEIENQLGVYETLFADNPEIAERLNTFRVRLATSLLQTEEEEIS